MTRYPRQVDREYLSNRSGGLHTIQMIDGGTLDLHQDLIACDRRRRYITEHQLSAVFQQSDRFHASSPRVYPVGATRADASEFRTCRSLFARTDCKRGKRRDALPSRTAPRSTSSSAEFCNTCLDFAARSRRW